MTINIKQSNKFGHNSSQISDSENSIKNTTKFVWKMRAEGFFSGIIISIIASYIYSFLTK